MSTIKKIYYSFVCYDPIVEILDEKCFEQNVDQKVKRHVASPIIANRKQKRAFYFEFIKKETSTNNK